MPRQNVNIGDTGSQLISKINANDVLALIGANNVEDYGAVHDGITDDTVAIQLALAATNVLYFPKGTYLCNLIITNHNFYLKGDGIGLTILKAYDNGGAVIAINGNVTGVDGWNIRDLTIDGNSVVNGIEFNTIPWSITEGIADHLIITNCLKALYFNSPAQGYLVYQNSFNMIKISNCLHGIYSEFRTLTYNNFSNMEIGVLGGGYSVYEDNGIENIFYNVKTTGVVNNLGTGNRFILFVIETITGNPPVGVAFNDIGENTHLDLILTDVNTEKCPIGYHVGAFGKIIINLKSWHSDYGNGNESAHLIEFDEVSSGIILHAQCQDSLKAITYLTPAQLQNWKCIEGNFFDGLISRVVYANAAPTTGTWAVKDICYNTEPSSGEYVGWICTVAGTSGTWKGFGLIE